MPLRVSNTVEKTVIAEQLGSPVTIAAITSTKVLDDISTSSVEYAGRYIQNVGSGILYYSIGQDCTPTSFHGILAPAASVNANGHGAGQQFDASNTGAAIYVYSVEGTVVSITILKREDLIKSNRNIYEQT